VVSLENSIRHFALQESVQAITSICGGKYNYCKSKYGDQGNVKATGYKTSNINFRTPNAEVAAIFYDAASNDQVRDDRNQQGLK
jgi:hypothetical protein